MTNTATIVAVVSLLGWLALSLPALRGMVAQYGKVTAIKAALVWCAVIAAVAGLAQYLGLHLN